MDILHANTEPPFLDRFRQLLGDTKRADIAVGYLFVSGFNAVADELAKVEKVRVLVGRTDRATLEEVARGIGQADALEAQLARDASFRKGERGDIGAGAVAAVRESIARAPQTDDEAAGLRRLFDLVANGVVEMRAYPRSVLHAKAYICYPISKAHYGSAIVGSSNFSLAGFTGNTELNVEVGGKSAMETLGRWFDALWADSIDVSNEIVVELQRSWAIAEPPPYHVYLKALYECYGDQLDAPELEPTTVTTPQLADFQLDAVRRAIGMIDRHGGCFIGDVVGLGKTYIGAEIVRQLQFSEPLGRLPLIICPAGLMPMWERVSERFGLGAEVLSMSSLAPPPGVDFDEETGRYVDTEPQDEHGIDLARDYPNRGVVLVDEAHNFRNPLTRRYAALSHYLTTGDHKVVLLSATPQNLGPADIYYQLRLFLDDLDHGLPLEPLHLQEYFGAVTRWYEYGIAVQNWQEDVNREMEAAKRAKKPPKLPAQPPQPTVPYAQIGEVLTPVFVRRRRKDIKELYGDDITINGKRVLFPEPTLENLTYRLDKVYAKAGRFTEIERKLRDHEGARYLAVRYLKPEAQRKPEYKDLLRARNRVARLIRFLLFKRLKSSVAAFRATLETLLRSNRNFTESLAAGFVPVGQTATNILAGADFDTDDLLHRLTVEEGARHERNAAKRRILVHKTADFNTEQWLHDLDRDHAVLTELHAAVVQITPDDDDKLRALRAFLDQPEVRAGKVLIFSEAEATVRYLYEQLNPGGEDATIERLSGANRSGIQNIVRRFAPAANLREGERLPGSEVRVLLATDVVSEGQNLQDCNRVLNYDLHWNPVRLIQRFGRVDRIGTAHERIFLHNTWPDTDVDAQLTLTERLHGRIQAFHDFIGLDTHLLSADERMNDGAMFRIYQDKRLPEGDDTLDEVAVHQRGISILQTLKQDEPGLWQEIVNMPDGLRAALPAKEGESRTSPIIDIQGRLPVMDYQPALGGVSPEDLPAVLRGGPQGGDTTVLFKHGGRTYPYAVAADLNPRPLTDGQLIAALECAPNTERKPLPPDTNQRVMAAYDETRRVLSGTLGRSRRPTTDTRVRRYIRKHLQLARALVEEDAQELRRVSVLQQIFNAPLQSTVTPALADIPRLGLTEMTLVRRLDALRERYRLSTPDEDEGAEQSAATEIVRIVCSNGLT